MGHERPHEADEGKTGERTWTWTNTRRHSRAHRTVMDPSGEGPAWTRQGRHETIRMEHEGLQAIAGSTRRVVPEVGEKGDMQQDKTSSAANERP